MLIKQIKDDPSIFLNYLKANYPLFHNSNFFFRDLQFGIKKYFEKKETKISLIESERAAEEISGYLEEKEIFIRLNKNTWKVNFPGFVTQVPGDPL